MKPMKFASLVSCGLLAAALLAGCGKTDTPHPPAESSGTTQATQEMQETQLTQSAQPNQETQPSQETQATQPTEITEPGASESIEDLNVGVVTTPYGTLYYHEQWRTYMQTHQQMEGDTLTVSFLAKINEVEYPLFQVIIGHPDAEPMAQLTDEQGIKRNVYVTVEEYPEYAQLDEGNQRLLYAMQEEVNFVFENIK